MNVPGEGMGPDGLSNYWNHRVLNEKELDEVFFVDRELNCVKHQYANGEGGPPSMNHEVPSKLNVDEAGWFELEYTLSPEGPSLARAIHAASGKKEITSPTQAVPGVHKLETHGELHVCEDQDGRVSVKAHFSTANQGWTAVGVRPPGSPCRMVPARAHVAHQIDQTWSVHSGQLENSMRGGSSASFLAKANKSTGVEVVREGGATTMSFSELLPRNREMEFSYAVGNSASMSYHKHRGCVSVSTIPKCVDMTTALGKSSSPTEASVARREASSTSECQLGLQAIQDKMSKLSTQLSEMTQPMCGQYLSVQKCNRWNLFCKWNSKTKKCGNR
jgi:hypothetical protein